ncbi:MAG: helix-turn-helix domain-containing protein [Burkholderiales bacterium]|nr:helix-turn-helix domain-containing protein [Burkholderiales bacterium]
MFEPLVLFDAALRGMVAALLLLAAGLMLRDRPRLPAAQAGALLTLGLVVQVFSSAPNFEQRVSCAAQSPLVGISVANAVLFWLFVRTLFDDDFRWRLWHAVVWALALAVGMLNCSMITGAPEWVTLLLRVLLRAVPLAAALLAVHAALQHWRDDLVEARRRLRVFVLVAGVAYTLLQLGLRLSAPQGRLSDGAALLDMAGLLVIAAGVSWRLLRLASTELFPALARTLPSTDAIAMPAPSSPADDAEDTSPPPLPPPDAAELRLAEALHKLMHRDRAYRSENLTVAALATMLSVPEYRLRRHINQRLGHRNFSAYVNGLRLDEAKAALADPARRDLPVLTIALTSGFQSIGPFNRAFKALTGLTPSEFRKENIADS